MMNFIMQVITRRVTALTYGADLFAAPHMLGFANIDAFQVSVLRRPSIAVIDDDHFSIRARFPSENHSAVSGRDDSCALCSTQIDALMSTATAGNPESGRDLRNFGLNRPT